MVKKQGKNIHFAKEIEYSSEPWLSDFIYGPKGAQEHGHMTMSGAQVIFMRGPQGETIIKDGKVIRKKQKQSGT
jgi:hypothetical protein